MIAAAALHDNHVNIFACHEPKHAAPPAVKTVKLWDGNGTTSLNRSSALA
jgi:regulator-associated protein of mTOR